MPLRISFLCLRSTSACLNFWKLITNYVLVKDILPLELFIFWLKVHYSKSFSLIHEPTCFLTFFASSFRFNPIFVYSLQIFFNRFKKHNWVEMSVSAMTEYVLRSYELGWKVQASSSFCTLNFRWVSNIYSVCYAFF